MELFAVIMAGGRGERFWPKSRNRRPKQLLDLFGGGTMLEQTIARLQGLVPPEKILILTNRDYEEPIRKLNTGVPDSHIIGEPARRDTAPCTALAAGIVKAMAETDNPVMLLLAADHRIADADAMREDFRLCAAAALEHDSLGTIGIHPDSPSSDYGYVECGDPTGDSSRLFLVKRFREKPSRGEAEKMLEQGNFRWNSGIFLFPVKAFARELEKNSPELGEFVSRCAAEWGKDTFSAFLDTAFPLLPKISVDYAVMEHAEKIILLEAGFDWDDIGNWTALSRHFPSDGKGNVVRGKGVLENCRECVIFSEGKEHLVAGVGLDNMIVVHTPDVTLIVPKERAGEIKALLKQISAGPEGDAYL